jgi:phage repressor protein C with HTH and peptisase S24 domain
MADEAAMTEEAERLRHWVQQAIDDLGIEAAPLSLSINKGKDYLRDFLTGKKQSISADALEAIRAKLAQKQSPAPMSDVKFVDRSPAPVVTLGEADLPVYAAAEGGDGVMVVSTDPVQLVQRPWFLHEVSEGYAVLVTGESMEPVYEPGDMAIVNPRWPLVRNKDVIIVCDESLGEFRAVIKRLIKWTDTHWHVRQFNEPRDFTLDRRDWPKAYRVVGRFAG